MRWLLIALVSLTAARPARAAEWRTDPAESRMTVHVFKRGLFSFLAHDHHFEVTDWRATLRLPEGDATGTAVSLVATAGSLRDRQPALSAEDLAKVNAQAAGSEVLDAGRFPRIEFRSTAFEIADAGDPLHVRGTLRGTLSIRGREVPIAVNVDARRSGDVWRVAGDALLRQTRLGIEPFSGFGGTVAVKDEVRVEIAALLRPVAPTATK